MSETQELTEQALANGLQMIFQWELFKEYDTRNRCVVKAVWLAMTLGYAAGFRFDPKEPDWPVAFINLPTGQVSWHLAQFPDPWDGHTTEEKYHRCHLYIESIVCNPTAAAS